MRCKFLLCSLWLLIVVASSCSMEMKSGDPYKKFRIVRGTWECSRDVKEINKNDNLKN